MLLVADKGRSQKAGSGQKVQRGCGETGVRSER